MSGGPYGPGGVLSDLGGGRGGGGGVPKVYSRRDPRSAVTHILKKKGCNSVREPLTEAPLSQHGTLSL